MAVSVWTSFQQISDANGVPYSGAKVNVFAAGTTTPLTLYSDSALSTTADNPIVCDSSGQHAMRYIATANYKTSVTTSGGTPLTNWSKDNIDPGVAVGSGALAVASGGTGATSAGSARTNLGAAAESTVTAIASDVTTAQADILELQGQPFGQCRLTKSGSNLLLSPYKGNKLTIDSVNCEVPDAGITLAPGSVPTLNLEYIYAYMNSGTMTLEYATTVPETQAGTGIKIKTGDSTRTLVGMAYAIAGPAWADTAAQRFVRSWFNDPGIALTNSFSTNRTTTSTTYAELNSEIRIEFLLWSSEIINFSFSGATTSNGSGANQTSIGIDSTTAEDVYSATACNAITGNIAGSLAKTGLSEGYHYATLLGLTQPTNTGTWVGSATASARTTLKGFARNS